MTFLVGMGAFAIGGVPDETWSTWLWQAFTILGFDVEVEANSASAVGSTAIADASVPVLAICASLRSAQAVASDIVEVIARIAGPNA